MSKIRYAYAEVKIRAGNTPDKTVMPVLFECSSLNTMPRRTPTEVMLAGVDELARLLALEGYAEDDLNEAIHVAYVRVREWRHEQKGLPR